MAKNSAIDRDADYLVGQSGSEIYAADAGSTDTYAITLAPVPTALTTGMEIRFKANTANTGACTLNVNSLGAKTIKKNYNSDLADNDIKANQQVVVTYDGTNFQLQTPSSNLAPATNTNQKTFVAGENITAGEPLYIKTSESIINLNTDTNSMSICGVQSGQAFQKGAQSFTLSSSLPVKSIRTMLDKYGSPTDNLVIRIETDNSGVPSGTLVDANATGSIAGTSLTTSAANYTVNFSGIFTLSASTLYWVVFDRSGSRDIVNAFDVYGISGAGSYTGGQKMSLETGDTWINNQNWIGDINLLIFGLDERVHKASTTSSATRQFIGFANETITSGNNIKVDIAGTNSSQSGLTPNGVYVLGSAAGTISLGSSPYTGQVIVGTALSATEITIGNVVPPTTADPISIPCSNSSRYPKYCDDLTNLITRDGTTNIQISINGVSSANGGNKYLSGVNQLKNMTDVWAVADNSHGVITVNGYFYCLLIDNGTSSGKIYRCPVTSDIATTGNWVELTISGTALTNAFWLIGYGDGKFWFADYSANFIPYILSGTTLTSGTNVNVTGSDYTPNSVVNSLGILATFSATPKLRFASFAGTLSGWSTRESDTIAQAIATPDNYYVAQYDSGSNLEGYRKIT